MAAADPGIEEPEEFVAERPEGTVMRPGKAAQRGAPALLALDRMFAAATAAAAAFAEFAPGDVQSTACGGNTIDPGPCDTTRKLPPPPRGAATPVVAACWRMCSGSTGTSGVAEGWAGELTTRTTDGPAIVVLPAVLTETCVNCLPGTVPAPGDCGIRRPGSFELDAVPVTSITEAGGVCDGVGVCPGTGGVAGGVGREDGGCAGPKTPLVGGSATDGEDPPAGMVPAVVTTEEPWTARVPLLEGDVAAGMLKLPDVGIDEPRVIVGGIEPMVRGVMGGDEIVTGAPETRLRGVIGGVVAMELPAIAPAAPPR